MQIKEVRVPNFIGLYRIVEIKPDRTEVKTSNFRVRKRIKVSGKWTMLTRTFGDFNEAKVFAKSTPAAIPTLIGETPKNRIVFNDVLQRFLNHKQFDMKLTRGTVDGLKNRSAHLKFFDGMDMHEIRPRILDGWVNLLLDPAYLAKQKKSRINYRHEFSLLSTLFKFYRNYEDENFVNPILDRHRERLCAKSRANKAHQIRFLNPVQENAFLNSFSENELFHDLALFQLQTGTRIGEAAAMEFQNIDFVRNELVVCQHIDWPRKKGDNLILQKGTKGGPIRVIPLSPKCRELLLRRRNSVSSTLVFPNASLSWISYREIQVFYDRAFEKADLIHRGSHTLRHTFAVQFLEQTKDIYALQRILGHASLEETQTYAKYTNESVKRAFLLFRGGKTDESTPLVSQLVSRSEV
jgi:integrase